MKLKYNEAPFPHIIVEDWYDEQELSAIWREIDFLSGPNKLKDADSTGTARDFGGAALKNNKGVWLDQVWAFDRSISGILTADRKLFHPKFTSKAMKHHWIFKLLKFCNLDTTLLSYYEDSMEYKPHEDMAYLTAITHHFKEPLSFDGGDLHFPEHGDYKVPLQNNRLIVFPSMILHSVDPIKMHKDIEGENMGRYTITQFLSLKA